MSTAWVDDLPPIEGPMHPQSAYIEKLRPLMKQPGRWAVIKSGTPGATHQAARALRLRQYHVPAGSWEFRVRSFRRGVHVGRGGTANLYARYLGPDDNHGPHTVRGYISKGAAYDEDGHRVCPECGERLERQPRQTVDGDVVSDGPWPKRCDACWDKVDSKWSRKRRRIRDAHEGAF